MKRWIILVLCSLFLAANFTGCGGEISTLQTSTAMLTTTAPSMITSPPIPTNTETQTLTFTTTPTRTITPTSTITPTVQVVNGCIQTVEKFIYQMHSGRVPTVISLPESPWQFVTNLPDPYYSPHSALYIEKIRLIAGEREFWMTSRYHFNQKGFLLYRPESGNSFEVEGLTKDETGKYLPFVYIDSQLLIANDGSVWGRNYVNDLVPEDSGLVPLFSKYNEDGQYFEVDTAGPYFDYLELKHYVGFLDEEFLDILVLVGPKGKFWVFHHSGLFSYDPLTQEIQDYPELVDLPVVVAAFSPKGTIYILKAENWDSMGLGEDELFEFDPESRDLVALDPPDLLWPDYGGFLVTQGGDLWINVHGYRSPDGTWHILNRDTEDYVMRGRTSATYNWAVPRLVTETSNGILWFTNDASETLGNTGTAWLDPQTGEGCWFMNNVGYVVEDAQHTLWMLVDAKLYKYPLYR